MKATGRFVILCTAVLLPGIALRAQAPSVFEPKVERRQGPPLWISAEAVADEEKIIDFDLIDSPFLQQQIEKQRRELGDRVLAEKLGAGEKPAVAAIPLSECKLTLYSTDQDHRGGTRSTATLSALASNSQSILRGTIRTVEMGFDNGIPASLLGVEVSEAIKGSAPAPLFYVLYPVARFRIGPLHFCNAEKGFEPHPGDQILLFDYNGTVDRAHTLFAPHLYQIFFQSRDGVLLFPRQLRDTPEVDSIRTLDEVVRRLSISDPSTNFRGGAQ